MTTAREGVVVAGGLAGAAIGFVVLSLGLGPVARLAPLVVGVPTVALLLVQWHRERRRSGSPGPEPAPPADVLRLVAWLPLLLVGVLVAGLVAGLPVWLAAFLRWRGRQPWAVALAFAAVLLVMLWFAVVVLVDASPTAGGVVPWGS